MGSNPLGRFQPCNDCCVYGCTLTDYDFGDVGNVGGLTGIETSWTLTGDWAYASGFYGELRGKSLPSVPAKAVWTSETTDDLPSLFSVRINWLIYVGHKVKLTVGNWEIIVTIVGGALPGVPYTAEAEYWEAGVLRDTSEANLSAYSEGSVVETRLCMFTETDGQLMVFLETAGASKFFTSDPMPAAGEISFEVLDYDPAEAADGVGFIRFRTQDTTDPACACPQGCAWCLYRNYATCYEVALAGMEGTWGTPPGCDDCSCLNGTFYISNNCFGSGTVTHWRCAESDKTCYDALGQPIDCVDMSISLTMGLAGSLYRYIVTISVETPTTSWPYIHTTIWTFYEDYADKQPCDQPLTLGLKTTTGTLATRCAGSAATVTLTPSSADPCPDTNPDLPQPCHFCDNCNDTPDELLLTVTWPDYYTCYTMLIGQYVLTRSTARGAWCGWSWASEDGNYNASFTIAKVHTRTYGPFIRITVIVRKIGGVGGTCTLSKITDFPFDYIDCQSTISGTFGTVLKPKGMWSVEPA